MVRPSEPDTNLLFEILSDWEGEIQSLNLDDHFEGLDDLSGGAIMTSPNSQTNERTLDSRSVQHSFEGFALTDQSDLADQHIGFRTTRAEKDKLLDLAHGRPLGAFIRAELLGRNVSKRKRRAPRHDEVILCKVLAALGNIRLSSHLAEIAKAAKRGAFPVTDELVMDLESACLDIRAMRISLMMALGFKTEGNIPPGSSSASSSAYSSR